jgi:uncharacterized protein YbbC (DUF1343 family)
MHWMRCLRGGIHVTKVFGLEHWVRGTKQAGEPRGSLVDPKRGLPLLNQFGMNPSEMVPLFGEVDELVFDIQDVGTRFYT